MTFRGLKPRKMIDDVLQPTMPWVELSRYMNDIQCTLLRRQRGRDDLITLELNQFRVQLFVTPCTVTADIRGTEQTR